MSGNRKTRYVRGRILMSGNAVATAHNLLTYGALFRSGIALHLFMVMLNVVAEVIAFFLFRRVNPLIATMALGSALVGASIESLDMLTSLLPLHIAGEHTMAAFSAPQRDALSYLALQLQDAGLLISFLFWGLGEVLTGYLIFRSGFLPRILGVLLGISCLVYLSDPLLSFGCPAIGALLSPTALALCLPGELLTALWTATVGLNVEKWELRTCRRIPRTPPERPPQPRDSQDSPIRCGRGSPIPIDARRLFRAGPGTVMTSTGLLLKSRSEPAGEVRGAGARDGPHRSVSCAMRIWRVAATRSARLTCIRPDSRPPQSMTPGRQLTSSGATTVRGLPTPSVGAPAA